MKVIVCISFVPDLTNELVISTDNKSINKDYITFIINPFDEYAIEEALQLKEKYGAETYAVTFGSHFHKEAIKKVYSLGIDKGTFILADSEVYDSFTVAKNLAEYIKEINPDITLFGKQSVDYDGITVQGMVSGLLNLPSVNVVSKIEYNQGEITVERDIEGGKELITLELPVLIGTQKGLNNPRYPKLKDVMSAKKKTIEERKAFYSGKNTEIIELKLSEMKTTGKILGDNINCITELVKLLREEINIL